ncbi:DUF4038 domain-containing protein [Rhizobium sp. Root482]|uniref:apiosidase-like domain-containing protein n=1 Tax=Rhizobium sp. Root482 TaxID=1736543 RepID=UPI001AEC701D|nr:DUF4038 domain-containing protein [Rhizobium sp. Root482]
MAVPDQGSFPCDPLRCVRLALLCIFAVLIALPTVAGERFPLTVSANGRHLIDAAGKPFLVSGDAAWSLIADLARDEIDLYLDSRSKLGFNTIVVSLIEHKFSRNAPRNAYGVAPFKADRAFFDPVDAYFDHAFWFIQQARARGFLVILAPAYLGIEGSDEGWSKEMAAAGPVELEAYGAYLGRRFASLPNIIWLQGGDADPRDKALVAAIVAGLKRTGSAALQSVHGNRDSVMGDVWSQAAWIDIGTVYTYGDVAAAMATARKALPGRPVLLLESAYEGERGTTAQDIRAAAWTAILSGGTGQVFGNNPVWHFAGPAPFQQKQEWREALASPGARDMSRMFAFFQDLDWWKIEPLCPPTGRNSVCGRASDHSFALVYTSGDPVVYLDAAATAGKRNSRWFDPSSGTISPAVSTQGAGKYRPPGPLNAAGGTDWVLLLTAR